MVSIADGLEGGQSSFTTTTSGPGVRGMLTVSSVLPAEEISIEDGPTLNVCDQSENCANL